MILMRLKEVTQDTKHLGQGMARKKKQEVKRHKKAQTRHNTGRHKTHTLSKKTIGRNPKGKTRGKLNSKT